MVTLNKAQLIKSGKDRSLFVFVGTPSTGRSPEHVFIHSTDTQAGKTICSARKYRRDISTLKCVQPYIYSPNQAIGTRRKTVKRNRRITHKHSSELLPITIKERLTLLSELPAGWNSYSAKPIVKDAIDKAKAILDYLKTRCTTQFIESIFISPCPDGGIQLEWESENNESILKIPPDAKNFITYFVGDAQNENECQLKSYKQLDSIGK